MFLAESGLPRAAVEEHWRVSERGDTETEHAIYATSFRKTNQHFPLVWALGNKNVPAENVTDRYAKPTPKSEAFRVMVRVLDAEKKRVAVPMTVTGEKTKLEGTSRGPTADLNDMLTFDLAPGKEYVVKVGDVEKKLTAGKVGEQQVVEIGLPK